MQAPAIVVRTRRPTVDKVALERAASSLYMLSLPLARRRGVQPFDGGVDVILVSPAASREAHLAVNGAQGETDVITIPYASSPLCPARAELIVCPAVALAEAAARDPDTLLPEERNRAWSADLELALYIAHGFDHLAGSDDSTPAGYRAMRRRELRWLDAVFPQSPSFFRQP